MAKDLFKRQIFLTAVVMLTVVMTCSSCETLKKKFTRKKKEGENQSIEAQPVLEPQEYPSPDKNPKEIYKQHYAIIKSFYHSLWAGVQERGTDGDIKFSIKQIKDHIEQMKPLLIPSKGKGLDDLEALLNSYSDSLGQPRQIRNYSRVQSDLRAFDRMLRDRYSFDVVKDDFIGGQ